MDLVRKLLLVEINRMLFWLCFIGETKSTNIVGRKIKLGWGQVINLDVNELELFYGVTWMSDCWLNDANDNYNFLWDNHLQKILKYSNNTY